MHRFARFAAGFAVLVLLTGMLPSSASAHEHRDIADGQYSMVVGFLVEPAFTGERNGLDLRVSKHDPAAEPAEAAEGEEDEEEAGEPVVGLDQTLKAEVIFGDQKMELTIEPRWQTPGAYDAYFFPTAATTPSTFSARSRGRRSTSRSRPRRKGSARWRRAKSWSSPSSRRLPDRGRARATPRARPPQHPG
jgi:hypothetical protein